MPSGVWADATSRRRLLALAPLLAGAGFALWTVAPSYPAFAVGFVLWGASGALQSGAFEALAYEELDHAGAASRYADVAGRAAAVCAVAATLAMGLAAPVLAAGGFVAVGATSVIACLAAAAVGASLPEHRVAPGGAAAGLRACSAILRDGVATVRANRKVRAALLAVPAVAAIWGSLDEYLPLLAVEQGQSDTTVPLLVLVVYAGVTAGGVLAGPAARVGTRVVAPVLALAAALLGAGALTGATFGFVLLAVAFGGFQVVTVLAEARLQEAITGRARSTVTSLAGLATEVLAVAVFAGYAAGSAVAGHATLFAAFAVVYLAIAIALTASGRP